MTNFPSSLDDSTTIPAESANTKLSTNHVTAHQNIQDAIEAIEAKVGANSSAVTTSHDYKLSEVTDKAVGKTATQTLTNKTLTSPVINLGSDAEGDTYYRNSSGALTRLAGGMDNYIYKMNGNVPNWEAEASNANASTTVAGIVELATSAQVTAGTATGETGAALVVTPDALAASTPVFNGSALTNLPYVGAIQTLTNATQSSGTSTIFTYTIPVLKANSFVEIELPYQIDSTSNSTAGTVTVTGKYSSSTVGTAQVEKTSIAPNNIGSGVMKWVFKNNGATNSQICTGAITNPALPNTTGNGFPVTGSNFTAGGTLTVDSTSTQTFTVESVFSSALGTATFSKPSIKILHQN